LPYYCTIGGWVLKYLAAFVTGASKTTAEDGYFGGYITSHFGPIIGLIVFLMMTAFVVYNGVNEGIEKYSKTLMPILLILVIGISIFSVTLKSTDADGITRTGLEGLKIYLVPDFSGMTIKGFIQLLLDAVGQLFYSISVAMGIMIAYGSYVNDDTNLMKSINQIEFFDTFVALLAGMMIVPAVFTFMGKDGMSAGPGLMFVSLPKVFEAMGGVGIVIGILFFIMVTFAAVTSSVSVMEAIVAGLMDKWKLSRKKSTVLVTLYALVLGIIVCLGYNVLYFEYTLPNGSVAQILDIMDYISNSILMPLGALVTCILFGWVTGPGYIINEVTNHGEIKFGRKHLFIIMIKFICPVILTILLLQALGVF